MVKIINGEIVQDNDPRLRKTAQSSQGRGGESSGAGRGPRVRNLFNMNENENEQQNHEAQTPNNAAYPQNNRNSMQPASVNQNPLDVIAKYLKIEDRSITIPAIPQLKLTESKIGLVYFLLLGVLCLIFGVKTILFAIFVYVIYKHSEKNNNSSN